MRTAEGKLHLYAGIDRTSKFAFVQLVTKANRVTASAFLVALIEAVPYKIHTVLTDNGIQFTFPPRSSQGLGFILSAPLRAVEGLTVRLLPT